MGCCNFYIVVSTILFFSHGIISVTGEMTDLAKTYVAAYNGVSLKTFNRLSTAKKIEVAREMVSRVGSVEKLKAALYTELERFPDMYTKALTDMFLALVENLEAVEKVSAPDGV